MIFASLDNGRPDGELCLVHPNRNVGLPVGKLVSNLREALEIWEEILPSLSTLDAKLRTNQIPHTKLLILTEVKLLACLPRTWLFADGSAYLHHVKLVRKARGAELPPKLLEVPLCYQAESSRFLSPQEPLPRYPEHFGLDFEGEVGVIVDFVEEGITPEMALTRIRMVTLINDVSLRGLIPDELAMGFGFFVSKPPKALAPFALTLDELQPFWAQGRLNLPLEVDLNGQMFGRASAAAMHFHFGQLIAHMAKTRSLSAGSLIGSGTVSEDAPNVGSSCIVEKRTLEQLSGGKAQTPYLKSGDEVLIRMRHPESGISLFGDIRQKVL